MGRLEVGDVVVIGVISIAPSSGSRLSCGALTKDSFLNLRAPLASRLVRRRVLRNLAFNEAIYDILVDFVR